MSTSHRQDETVNLPGRADGWIERLRRRRRPWKTVAGRLYERVVEQARRPEFYRDAGVPDDLDGRFDLIVLHAFFVLYRLRDAGSDGGALGQELFDVMFADMDRSLREMGVGDLGVGKRVKDMLRAFYGRVAAYEAAIAEDDPAVAEILRRNLFGGTGSDEARLAALAAYVRDQTMNGGQEDLSELLAGNPRFASPPGPIAGTDDGSAQAARGREND